MKWQNSMFKVMKDIGIKSVNYRFQKTSLSGRSNANVISMRVRILNGFPASKFEIVFVWIPEIWLSSL